MNALPCGPGKPCECLDNDTSGSIDAFDLASRLGNGGPCVGPGIFAPAVALAQSRTLGLVIEDRELQAWGEVLGDQFGAISQDVLNQGKKDAKHAHLTVLRSC